MDEFIVKLAKGASNVKKSVFKTHKDDSISLSTAKMRREHDNHPWQIKVGTGRNAKKYRATREGGINDNASYYIFYKCPTKPDTYEVCPIDEWYSVSATQRYKTLTAEEAEKKYEERFKTLNMFSVMARNRGDNEDDSGGGDYKEFKVLEEDDWNSNDDESGSDADNEGGIRKKKKTKSRRIKDEDDPDKINAEAAEESDEGDFEQREVDYMSEYSSDSESDNENKDATDVKGIAEEGGLRDLLNSDEEEDEEAQPLDPSQNSKLPNDNGSDLSSDSDSDLDGESSDAFLPEQVIDNEEPSSSKSTVVKRKAPIDIELNTASSSAKKSGRVEFVTAPQTQERAIEMLIRKELSRRPMTLSMMIKKINSKVKITEELMQEVASIIGKVCVKEKINEVTWLKIKDNA